MHTGAELALEDAETILMHAKKEVLALEMKLHDAMKQKSDCLSELTKAQEELRQDERDLLAANAAVQRAVQQRDLEKSLTATLQKLADIQKEQLSSTVARHKRYKSAVATGEGLRMVEHEIVKESIIQDELEASPEYKEAQAEHHKQLQELQAAASEEGMLASIALADQGDQFRQEVQQLTEKREEQADPGYSPTMRRHKHKDHHRKTRQH